METPQTQPLHQRFLPELLAQSTLLEQCVLALAMNESPSARLEVLRQAFNAVHTLKSAANTLECPMLWDLANTVESLLRSLRDTVPEHSYPLIGLLNMTLVNLAETLEGVSQSNPPDDHTMKWRMAREVA
jgi:chemotaxis protein histidine kinase CheA